MEKPLSKALSHVNSKDAKQLANGPYSLIKVFAFQVPFKIVAGKILMFVFLLLLLLLFFRENKS